MSIGFGTVVILLLLLGCGVTATVNSVVPAAHLVIVLCGKTGL